MRGVCCVVTLLCCSLATMAQVRVAEGGAARCVIVTQPGATATERYAADELAKWIGEIAGARIEVRDVSSEVQANAIIVGPGMVASALFPDLKLDKLGGEEYVIRTNGGRMLVAGGRPRGTLYAVYRLLQDHLGIRWYAPWCTKVPKQATLTLPALNVRGKPAFEYREPYWFPAFDGDWAARNGVNGQQARLTEKHGGQIRYTGFVHTFYPLAPPERYFKTHPEWYSLVRGQRVDKNAQLCTTNPELREHIVAEVKRWLRESPGVNIVSVSQNDHAGACECDRCKAIDDREGTPAGSLLELVNYVAEKIEPEFPNVAVDTLAYQYTRQAPKTIKPRHNVIVRLCSIECNFAQTLEHPSNASFARDIRDWHRLTNRLYVWDYTTDFSHYLLPFPNWYVLGSNDRFFHRNGVRGLFEQGNSSPGGEMQELRAWVLAQLIWNPYQDDHKLVREFIEAYYGAAAAPHILAYFDVVRQRAQPYYMGIGHPDASPYLRFDTLSRCERLWQQAEDAARSDPDHLWRVRQARVPVHYMWLSQWVGLRRECRAAGAEWPIASSRKTFAEQWISTVNAPGPPGWVAMDRMRESGQEPAGFAASLASDPDPSLYESPVRHAAGPTPAGLPEAERRTAIDVQDDRFVIFREPECARPVADPAASDGVAVRMVPGAAGARGAVEVLGGSLPKSMKPGRYRYYVIARAEIAPGTPPWTVAFRGRVAHNLGLGYTGDRSVLVGEVQSGYHAYYIGTVEVHPYVRIWFGHERQPGVQTVWFDRALLVPER